MNVHEPIQWLNLIGGDRQLMPYLTHGAPIVMPNCGTRVLSVDARTLERIDYYKCHGLALFSSAQATVGAAAFVVDDTGANEDCDQSPGSGFQLVTLAIAGRIVLRPDPWSEQQSAETVETIGPRESAQIVELKKLITRVRKESPRTAIFRALHQLYEDPELLRSLKIDEMVDRVADVVLVEQRQSFCEEVDPKVRMAVVLNAIKGALGESQEGGPPEDEVLPWIEGDDDDDDVVDREPVTSTERSWTDTRKLIIAATPAALRAATARELSLLEMSQSEASRQRRQILQVCDWSRDRLHSVNIDKLERTLSESHVGHGPVLGELVEIAMMVNFKSRRVGHAVWPALLLVGPPGVGKTSLARDFAVGLERSSYRLDFGTFDDVNSVLGTSEVYRNAALGGIMTGIITAGADCVLVLDEIDKATTQNSNGSPLSALLGILGDEKSVVRDVFLGFPYPFQGIWMATANDVSTIPDPLLDRFRVIEVPGYSLGEKAFLIRKVLLQRVLDEFGLFPQEVHLADSGVSALVELSSENPGARALFANLRRVVSHAARQLASGADEVLLDHETVLLLLGGWLKQRE